MKAPNSSCLSLINFIPTFYVPLSDFGGGSQSQAGGLEQGRQRGTGRLVGGHGKVMRVEIGILDPAKLTWQWKT